MPHCQRPRRHRLPRGVRRRGRIGPQRGHAVLCARALARSHRVHAGRQDPRRALLHLELVRPRFPIRRHQLQVTELVVTPGSVHAHLIPAVVRILGHLVRRRPGLLLAVLLILILAAQADALAGLGAGSDVALPLLLHVSKRLGTAGVQDVRDLQLCQGLRLVLLVLLLVGGQRLPEGLLVLLHLHLEVLLLAFETLPLLRPGSHLALELSVKRRHVFGERGNDLLLALVLLHQLGVLLPRALKQLVELQDLSLELLLLAQGRITAPQLPDVLLM
mmetsp:Transcript_26926/g.68438  ORF Transcript_26926/g.68438 Transcript_26926/m.68438 type:complete len:275 (-) Transcript_26926:244-1068(-)